MKGQQLPPAIITWTIKDYNVHEPKTNPIFDDCLMSAEPEPDWWKEENEFYL